MLTPEQITALGDQAQKLADPIVEFLLKDIARRVSEAGQLTSTASYQVWRAQQLGISQREIKKRLKKLLKVSNRELRQLLTQAAEVGYDFDIKHLPQVQAVPFAKNPGVQQIVQAAVDLALDDFTNLTQTLGMVDPHGKAMELQKVYRSCTDFAFEQVITGAADYNTAIRQATKNLAEKGLLTIDYESGVHTSLEAAIRRNMMGGLGLMQEQISQHNHDSLGCDGWEISAHANSAPDHEPIQGRRYSDAEYTALNNSLLRRIGTLNCGHAAFPIIMGVNSPQYTPAELEQFREDNAKGVTVDGKHYTGYEATQMQRRLERAIRKQKRRILVAGDEDIRAVAQTRLQRMRQEYSRFSKAAGLRTQDERLHVAGFGRKEASVATSTAEDVFVNTKMDVQTMSQKIDKVLNRFCKQKSKWSGKTVVLARKDMIGIAGRKEWSCDITLREDAGIKTVIHEHLHARSISYYNPDTYLKFRNIEEASVELFAQEICKLRGAKFKESYSGVVKPLRIINSIVKIDTEYSFAKQLFDTPLPERYNWLEEKANAIISDNKLSPKTIGHLRMALKFFEVEEV